MGWLWSAGMETSFEVFRWRLEGEGVLGMETLLA